MYLYFQLVLKPLSFARRKGCAEHNMSVVIKGKSMRKSKNKTIKNLQMQFTSYNGGRQDKEANSS